MDHIASPQSMLLFDLPNFEEEEETTRTKFDARDTTQTFLEDLPPELLVTILSQGLD